MIVDFIYDVATPNGYLAHKVIPEFEKRTNTSFNYIPCLAGGIFKLTNNTPPLIANADVKNKSDYFFVTLICPRRIGCEVHKRESESERVLY